MLSEMIAVIIFFVAIFIIIVITCEERFTLIIGEQVRYFFLNAFYTPLPRTITTLKKSPHLSFYLPRDTGEQTDPAGSVHVQNTGKFRYGKRPSTDFEITSVEFEKVNKKLRKGEYS